LNADEGIYNIVVVNIYNGNFGSAINSSNPGNLNDSNPVEYYVYAS
jgi:hypothetical protein